MYKVCSKAALVLIAAVLSCYLAMPPGVLYCRVTTSAQLLFLQLKLTMVLLLSFCATTCCPCICFAVLAEPAPAAKPSKKKDKKGKKDISSLFAALGEDGEAPAGAAVAAVAAL
jgi:hypothetical protein